MLMRHPDIAAPAQCVSRSQFDAVFAGKGWELVDVDAPLEPRPLRADAAAPPELADPHGDLDLATAALPPAATDPDTTPHEGPTTQES